MKTVNVSAVLDEGRWTGYQKLLIFGTALLLYTRALNAAT